MGVIIHRLHGVSSEIESKLRSVGVRDSSDLLKVCQVHRGIADLAGTLGLDNQEILRLAHRADLARIRGIGAAYTELLEAAGVHSMNDLASACPETLRSQFNQLNDEKRLVGRVPAQAMVNGWVLKARKLPRVF